jgi:hypothetical protein
MEVSFHANICDAKTYAISQALHSPLREVAGDLEGEYGGIMEHLWIDFELTPLGARKPRTFRFQRRVSGRSPFGGPAIPDSFNVGHYCVYPNLKELIAVPLSGVVSQALSLIYESTAELDRVARRLRGFNIDLFRSRFCAACASHGYVLHIASHSAP